MKRRQFMQALATVPVATTLVQQPPAAPPAPAGTGRGRGGGAVQAPPQEPLDYTVADDAAEPVPRFFEAAQLAALTRLGDVLFPAVADTPGAVGCRSAEFLDFVLSQSPVTQQQLYRSGVDSLNGQARRRFSKAFSAVTAAEADTILEPLRRPWSYAPADPFEVFLRTAHRDLRTANENSRERALATGNVRTVRWLRPL